MPRRFMSRRTILLLTAAVLIIAGLVFVYATLPPLATIVDDRAWHPALPGAVVAGAMHVHTDRSDGAGTMDEVAAAAARVGLQFVVFGDHGNAMRPLEPPAYRSGVLCIDGVEISTSGGHYLALDLAAAPYPLAGEPRDVVEDVRRLGGWGVVAHPTSPKQSLQWLDWSAPFDGLEWLNADSEWRDESRWTLARLLLDYFVRPTAALASTLDRPSLALARWDALGSRRRIVGVAGADAHGRIDFGGDPYAGGNVSPLRVPSYDASFGTFSVRVELDEPFSGVADRDGAALLGAVRGGRVFTAIDAVARPAHFEFSASSGNATSRMGGTLPPGPARFQVRTILPPGGSVVLLRDGEVVQTSASGDLTYDTSVGAGVFRAEVQLAGAPGTPPIPWILGNPIYLGPRSAEGKPLPTRPGPRGTRQVFSDGDTTGWRIERDAGSLGAVDSTKTIDGRELAFRYGLRGAPVASQYVALAYDLAGQGEPRGLAGFDRLMFKARSSHPMRLEVQIRQPGGRDGERWVRSIYLDEQSRDVTVFFDDMTPIGRTEGWRPTLAQVASMLFVVDTIHNLPSSSGIVWLDDVKLGRS